MKRVTIRARGLVSTVLVLSLVQACSSSDEDQDVGSLMGSGGSTAPVGAGGSAAAPASGNGGAMPAPGNTPTAAAGTEGNPAAVAPPAAGGTANASSGAMGSAGSAMTGEAGAGGAPPVAPTPDALCPPQEPSPADMVACTVTCTDPCGIKNLGTRLCTCTANVFDCAACAFTVDSGLLEPPTEPLPDCPLSDDLQEDDETGCTDNQRCQSIGRTPGATDGANRFCGCLDGTWDCDTKPASFGG
jgi:hypothetical protein